MNKIELAKRLSLSTEKLKPEYFYEVEEDFLISWVTKKNEIYLALPQYLKENYNIASAVVQSNANYYTKIPESLQYNKQFILDSFKNNRDTCYFGDDIRLHFKDDIKFLEKLVLAQPSFYHDSPEEILLNENIAETLIAEDDFYIIYSPEFLEKHYDFVENLIFKHPQIFYCLMIWRSEKLFLMVLDYILKNDDYFEISKFSNIISHNPSYIKILNKYFIDNKIYKTEQLEVFLRILREDMNYISELYNLVESLLEPSEKDIFNRFIYGNPPQSKEPYYITDKHFYLETDPDYLCDIEEIDKQLNEHMPKQDRMFLNALIDDFLARGDKSIFHKYFNGTHFYKTNHGLASCGIENDEDITFLTRTACNKIMDEGCYLFEYRYNEADFLFFYEGNYFSYNDEGELSCLDCEIYEIPNKFVGYVDEYENENKDIIDFTEYVDFCKKLGINFIGETPEVFIARDPYKKYDLKNVKPMDAEDHLTHRYLEQFIEDLKKEQEQDEIIKKIFNMQELELGVVPEHSYICHRFNIQNREFSVTYNGLVYEHVDNKIIPYCDDFPSLPWFFKNEEIITQEDYLHYKESLENLGYEIKEFFSYYAPDDDFWDYSYHKIKQEL